MPPVNGTNQVGADLPALAKLSVRQDTPSERGGAHFTITGSDFRPEVTIRIDVRNRSDIYLPLVSDRKGRLDFRVSFACDSGERLTISAFDDGVQVSDTVTIDCF